MNQNQICHIFQRFPTRVLVARQKESGASYMTTRYKGSLFPHGDGTEITAPDATVNDTSTHTVTPTRASSVAPQLNTHWATPAAPQLILSVTYCAVCKTVFSLVASSVSQRLKRSTYFAQKAFTCARVTSLTIIVNNC